MKIIPSDACLLCPGMECRAVSQVQASEDEAIKTAADSLLLSLEARFGDVFAATLAEMLTSVQSSSFDAASDDQLLLTDSVYKVMGVTAFNMSSYVDFTRWFMTNLAPILQVTVPCRLGVGRVSLGWCPSCGCVACRTRCRRPVTCKASLLFVVLSGFTRVPQRQIWRYYVVWSFGGKLQGDMLSPSHTSHPPISHYFCT